MTTEERIYEMSYPGHPDDWKVVTEDYVRERVDGYYKDVDLLLDNQPEDRMFRTSFALYRWRKLVKLAHGVFTYGDYFLTFADAIDGNETWCVGTELKNAVGMFIPEESILLWSYGPQSKALEWISQNPRDES